MTSAYTTIGVTRAHRIAVLRLDRPQVRNAFNETMIAELTNAFAELSADPDVLAVVLAAEGPVFSAGADLDWMRRMAGYSHEQNLADARALAFMLRTIDRCDKPVIARVHGDAYAGGMGLVAACDIAVAAHEAAFCLSEVKLGLIPATIGPYVVRAMGEQSARRYMITGERFDAPEAFRIGFVHEITTATTLDARINEMLGALVTASPNAVREAKRLVHDLAGRPIDDALVDDTAQRIARIRASDDGREGVQAFLAKRKPAWLARHEADLAATDDDEDM